MITLKYYSKSWHSILYKSTYGGSLPVSLCTYFWKLVAAIVIFPLVLPGHILNICEKDYDSDVKFGLLLHLLIILLGGVALIVVACIFPDIARMPIPTLNGVLILYLLSPLGLLLVSLVIAIIFYVDGLKETYYIRKANKKSLLIEGIKATINRACPKIEWVDKK